MRSDQPSFPTHDSVGLAAPDWTSGPEFDASGFHKLALAGVRVPRGEAPHGQIVDLVREQLAGLLAAVELPINADTIDLAAETMVSQSEKFQQDPVERTRAEVLYELDDADAHLEMTESNDAVARAGAQQYASHVQGAVVDDFATLPLLERGRWAWAAAAATGNEDAWERERARLNSTRTSRDEQVRQTEGP